MSERAIIGTLRRWTILTHRYLGIPLSLLFVVWFISGVAMMYARGMPSLTPETRLERLPALDWGQVRLTPAEAEEAALLGQAPGGTTLLMIQGRPAYRFATRGPVTVFADTGEVFYELGTAGALDVAARFMGFDAGERAQLDHVGLLDAPDQWTIGARGDLPLHHIRVADDSGTELYVSESTGEVSVLTTRGSRALAWVAAIPHWLYFAPLRLNGPLWSQTVIWLSVIGCAMALLGILVGFLTLRPTRPYRVARLMSWVPYRGWMRWHWITGLVFGVFTLTWVFSGLLSMDPWGWGNSGGLGVGELQRTFTGGTLDIRSFPQWSGSQWQVLSEGGPVKEVEFLRIQGAPYFSTTNADGDELLLSALAPGSPPPAFDTEMLLDQIQTVYEDVDVVTSEVLDEYDAYYYQRGGAPPLPVLRVKFDDPDATWLYVDPARSRLVGRMTRHDRLDRWIYNGFHSLDFGFWYNSRPAWDIGVILLSLGGLSTSLIGMALGFKRLGRGLTRPLRALAGAATARRGNSETR